MTTPAQEQTKKCSKCGRELSIVMFYERNTSRDGLRNECKKCLSQIKKKRQQKLSSRTVIEYPKEKLCPDCKKILPVTLFHSNRAKLDGLSSQCVDCTVIRHQKYKEENREKIKVASHAKYEKNKNKYAKKQKERYAVYKDEILARHRAWYQKNKDQCLKRQKEYALENSDKIKKYHKDYREHNKNPDYHTAWNLEHKYKMSIAEWNELFESQGCRCAICGCEYSNKWWNTDHNHRTGRVRGILCSNCNTAIGHLQDSPSLLRSAADYLEKHQE